MLNFATATIRSCRKIILMTAIIHIPPLLRRQFGGRSEIPARGSTLEECLRNMINEYPELEIRLKSLAVCLNGEIVQLIHYSVREIKTGDEITFLPKMSGG